MSLDGPLFFKLPDELIETIFGLYTLADFDVLCAAYACRRFLHLVKTSRDPCVASALDMKGRWVLEAGFTGFSPSQCALFRQYVLQMITSMISLDEGNITGLTRLFWFVFTAVPPAIIDDALEKILSSVPIYFCCGCTGHLFAVKLLQTMDKAPEFSIIAKRITDWLQATCRKIDPIYDFGDYCFDIIAQLR